MLAANHLPKLQCSQLQVNNFAERQEGIRPAFTTGTHAHARSFSPPVNDNRVAALTCAVLKSLCSMRAFISANSGIPGHVSMQKHLQPNGFVYFRSAAKGTGAKVHN